MAVSYCPASARNPKRTCVKMDERNRTMKRKIWVALFAFLCLHLFSGCVAVLRERPVFPENPEAVIARSENEEEKPRRRKSPFREFHHFFEAVGKSAFLIIEECQRIYFVPLTSSKVDKVHLKVDLLVVLK